MLWWLFFGDSFISISTVFSRLIYTEAYVSASCLFMAKKKKSSLWQERPGHASLKDRWVKTAKEVKGGGEEEKFPLLPIFMKMYASFLTQKWQKPIAGDGCRAFLRTPARGSYITKLAAQSYLFPVPGSFPTPSPQVLPSVLRLPW